LTFPLFAPAKLNLYLHVTGKRGDGYHLLDSLVAFADIGDILTISPAQSLSLEITGPFARDLGGDNTSNLVWRAAELLAGELKRKPQALIVLRKNLPIASGIGGGSSDAAAALKALDALWQGGLGHAELARLARKLGADVPVCVAAKTSWLGGIGEAVSPAPKLPNSCLVLVNPNKALPTPDVFKTRRGPYARPARFTRPPSDTAGLAAMLRARGNGLTDAALALMPEIGEVLARLEACKGALIARMSGSGATCFALFGNRTDANAALLRLKSEKPGWWVASGKLL
jgi:4-diphosphocytidyl-2-C-methyl-D-erythritol kinase